ncbi:MAG: hypothetical protein LBN27_05070 [Prevotellaceae bacterium]|jgi:hypothetical protein|nr:hypothetical protein [Prevotellaceae bacterium]
MMTIDRNSNVVIVKKEFFTKATTYDKLSYSFEKDLLIVYELGQKITSEYLKNKIIVGNELLTPENADESLTNILSLSGTPESEYLKLSSEETQVIDSDISLGLGKKFLGTDSNGSEHELIGLNEYDGGQQVEVGSENEALCLNHNAKGFDGELPGDKHITVNGKDENGAVFTDKVAYLSDLNDAIPVVPEEDGTYILKVTVTDGVATRSWVAE